MNTTVLDRPLVAPTTGATVRTTPQLQQGPQPQAAAAASIVPDYKDLKIRLRETISDGVDSLEKHIGEMVIWDRRLLQQAGELLAGKIVKSPGMTSVSGQITAIFEVGSGLYPGLGLSVAQALVQYPTMNFKDLRIICSSWNNPQLPTLASKSSSGNTGPSVLIVTSSRTYESAKRMNAFVKVLRDQVGVGVNIAGIVSLVCLEEDGKEIEVSSAGGGNNNVKYVDGMKVSE